MKLWIFSAENCRKIKSHQRWLLFIFDESQFISSSIIWMFTRSRHSPSMFHFNCFHLVLTPPEINILLFHLFYLRLNVLVHDFVITGNTRTHKNTKKEIERQTTYTKFDIMTQKSPLCVELWMPTLLQPHFNVQHFHITFANNDRNEKRTERERESKKNVDDIAAVCSSTCLHSNWTL